MTKTIRISDSLSLPLEFVTQAGAVIAKRRVGKSYLTRKICEQLIKAVQQVILVDPKGDQWGICSSADGKSPGLGVTIFGGARGDVPISPKSGELVARIAVEERPNMLLHVASLKKGERARFLSTRDSYIQRMGAAGSVEQRGDRILATEEGLERLGGFDPLPTGRALLDHWLAELPEGESKVLAVVADAYPNAVHRLEIDKQTGFKRSTRDSYLQRLGARRLVVTERNANVALAEELVG